MLRWTSLIEILIFLTASSAPLLSLSLSLHPPLLSSPCPESYFQASSTKRVLSDRPFCRAFYLSALLPLSCPTLAIDPRSNHLTQRATCVPDVAQTKRFIIVPRTRVCMCVCVYIYVWELCPVAHVIIVIVSRHFRATCALSARWERHTRWILPDVR